MSFVTEIVGVATATAQTTGNNLLSNLDIKTPPLGQGLMAASVPVVLASNHSALAVTGTFFQATQPVSGTVAISNLPATQPVSGTVAVSNFPASQAVTGSFFQVTQPVSIASMPSTPVTGTFWQATQPISGAVSVSNFPATQAISAVSLPLPTGASTESTLLAMSAKLPSALGTKTIANSMAINLASDQTIPVTGTFFQATQPVSGTVAVSNFPASQAVTGTFFQATQPVSGPLTDTQLRASVVPISGTVTANAGSGTQATSNTNIDVALSTRLKPADTLAGVTTVGTVTTVAAVTAITNQLPAGANKIGTVDIATAVATAKGTQGANALPIQQLKDAGRNITNYFMALPIVSTATDTLMSLTGYKSGAAVAATTTPAVVTAGKVYRINAITISYTTIVTTPGAVKFTLRANPAGVALITSPAVKIFMVGEPTGIAPVAGKINTVTFPIPGGMEFAAGTGIGMSMVGLNATNVAAAVGFGRCDIDGNEY